MGLWRKPAVVLLILLGCIVATVSVPVIWMRAEVMDADRYAETVSPLSQDPAIKDAVATRLTDELFTRVQADQLAAEALPDKLDWLASPIVGATEGFVQEQIRKLLDTQEFTRIWTDANRKGHEVVIQVLQGQGESVYAEQGRIVLDLSGLVDVVKTRLGDRGIHIFDSVSLADPGFQFTLFESASITTLQRALDLLDRLAFWLPAGALLLLLGAVWLSSSRAAAILQIGLGLAAGMVALLVTISWARGSYIDSVSASGNVDLPAATAFFDIITGSLATSIKRTFAAGLLLASLGFSFSPYPAARQLRALIWQLYSRAEDQGKKVNLGPAGAWIARQKAVLRAAGVAVALLILVVTDQPTLSWALLILFILGVYLLVIEVLGRRA